MFRRESGVILVVCAKLGRLIGLLGRIACVGFFFVLSNAISRVIGYIGLLNFLVLFCYNSSCIGKKTELAIYISLN
uniref:Uncharacterized protein n=1 Tax=Arundo donax TaxID=35708 RepID=A0A0A9F1J3_ARUDO